MTNNYLEDTGFHRYEQAAMQRHHFYMRATKLFSTEQTAEKPSLDSQSSHNLRQQKILDTGGRLGQVINYWYDRQIG